MAGQNEAICSLRGKGAAAARASLVDLPSEDGVPVALGLPLPAGCGVPYLRVVDDYKHLGSTITEGNAQAGAAAHFPPLRWPDCTLSRLRAEEYDRPVTQSIATPEPGCPDPHPRSSRSLLRP